MGHLPPWLDANLSFSDTSTHLTFPKPDSCFSPGLCPHHFCRLGHPFFCLCLFPAFLFLQSQVPRPQTCQASHAKLSKLSSALLLPGACHSPGSRNTSLRTAALCQAHCQAQCQVCVCLCVLLHALCCVGMRCDILTCKVLVNILVYSEKIEMCTKIMSQETYPSSFL